MKTRELQKLWWDWLSTAERLLRSLAEQTAALTLRDVARVERIQPELETMLERMQTIDGLASAAATKLAEELGTEPSLRGIVAALNRAEAQQVQAIANRVKIVGNNVSESFSKNKKLIQNELTYVSGTLTLIAKSANDQNNKFAQGVNTVLVDQVA